LPEGRRRHADPVRRHALADPAPHEDVCLITGMISAFPTLFEQAEEALARRFGRISRASKIMPFDFTDYYAPQMGENLQRKFVAFEKPFEPSLLAPAKLWTNDLETRLTGNEFPVSRPINLDPGYVTPAKLVLATTKDYPHRLYIGGGIYAEVTLSFVDKAWRPNDWTYPDYQTEPYHRFFEAVRSDLLERRKHGIGRES